MSDVTPQDDPQPEEHGKAEGDLAIGKARDAESIQKAPPDKMSVAVPAIYLLLIAGFFSSWLMPAGGVMAYLMRFGAKGKSQSHYVFLIRNFWIQACLLAVLYFFILGVPVPRYRSGPNPVVDYMAQSDFMALFAGVGGVAIGVVMLWLAARYLRGIYLVMRKRAHPSPNTAF